MKMSGIPCVAEQNSQYTIPKFVFRNHVPVGPNVKPLSPAVKYLKNFLKMQTRYLNKFIGIQYIIYSKDAPDSSLWINFLLVFQSHNIVIACIEPDYPLRPYEEIKRMNAVSHCLGNKILFIRLHNCELLVKDAAGMQELEKKFNLLVNVILHNSEESNLISAEGEKFNTRIELYDKGFNPESITHTRVPSETDLFFTSFAKKVSGESSGAI